MPRLLEIIQLTPIAWKHILAIYDKSRNHKCPTCNRAFAIHSNLSAHSKAIHSIAIWKSQVIYPRICKDCGAATKHSSRHICQDKKIKFQCHCGKTFRSHYHLLRHAGSKKCGMGISDDGSHSRGLGYKLENAIRKRSGIYLLHN
jgi:hypothetical protein